MVPGNLSLHCPYCVGEARVTTRIQVTMVRRTLAVAASESTRMGVFVLAHHWHVFGNVRPR